jgi:hypothetical protein
MLANKISNGISKLGNSITGKETPISSTEINTKNSTVDTSEVNTTEIKTENKQQNNSEESVEYNNGASGYSHGYTETNSSTSSDFRENIEKEIAKGKDMDS